MRGRPLALRATGFRVGPFAVAAVFVAATLIVSGCQITVTHESRPQYHATTPEDSLAKFDDSVPDGQGPSAYNGSGKAQATYKGGGDVTSAHAYGELSAGQVDTDDDALFGAAIYFEPGTLAGERPAQRGTIDLMRWVDGPNWGGVRIGEDHRAHLVDSMGGDVESNREFAFEEGCWNWVVVHQKLRSMAADQPVSEVYLNGRKMLSSSNVNTTLPIVGGVDKVQFGLVQMGSHPGQETSGLNVYLDDSFISDSSDPNSRPMVKQSAGQLCHPLPNVLFIVSDDQRADTMLGSSNPIGDLVMPKTRQWFRNGSGSIPGGTEFSNAFVTTPLCCPSRASIMTGEYAHNHGKKTLDEAEFDAFNPNLRYTVQRYLHDWWGYRTALFGKFLNSWTLIYDFDPSTPEPPPPDTHFDEYGMFDGQYQSGATPRPCTNSQSHSCTFVKPPVEVGGQSLDAFEPGMPTTDYVKARALKFIDDQDATNDAQPWFMYVAPFQPHEEGTRWGPDAWCKMTNSSVNANLTKEAIGPPELGPQYYETDLSDKPPWVRNWNEDRTIFEPDLGTAPCSSDYRGLREQQIRTLGDVDQLVDAIFTELDNKGEADDTLAVYISDNGYMWREHSPQSSGIPSECNQDIYNSGSSGTPIPCGISSKGKPYRESIQVPMYFRWPDRPPGWDFPQPDPKLVANIDMAPTAMDAVGGLSLPPAQFDQPMDGRSLLSPPRAVLLTEGWPLAGEQGIPTWASLVKQNGDQYIFTDRDELPDTNEADATWEEQYTNLLTDGQRTNQFGDNGHWEPSEPARLFTLDQLEHWRTCTGASCP
jgi:arylsulfatase A-like enzyme